MDDQGNAMKITQQGGGFIKDGNMGLGDGAEFHECDTEDTIKNKGEKPQRLLGYHEGDVADVMATNPIVIPGSLLRKRGEMRPCLVDFIPPAEGMQVLTTPRANMPNLPMPSPLLKWGDNNISHPTLHCTKAVT